MIIVDVTVVFVMTQKNYAMPPSNMCVNHIIVYSKRYAKDVWKVNGVLSLLKISYKIMCGTHRCMIFISLLIMLLT